MLGYCKITLFNQKTPEKIQVISLIVTKSPQPYQIHTNGGFCQTHARQVHTL